MKSKFSGYCVVIEKADRTMLVTNVGFFKRSVSLITEDAPAKFNWSDRNLVKLARSERSAMRLMCRIEDAWFAQLFSGIRIAEVHVDLIDKSVKIK